MGNNNVPVGFYILIILGILFTEIYCKAPIIESFKGNEYVATANTNFNLTCTGDKPITWTYPNETVDGGFFSEMHVSTLFKDKTHIALLSISNISFVDTGFYYCHEMNAKTDEYGRSSSIYIYVKDEEHLSVIDSDIELLSVVENSNVIIPCRPTSPDVQVSLLESNEEPIENYQNYFNKKIGFTFPTISLLNSGTYKCLFSYKDREEEIIYHIKVLSATSSIQKPKISALNNGKTSIGQTLILNCSVIVDLNVYYSLNWTVPKMSDIKTGRIKFTNATKEKDEPKKGRSMLIVENVTAEDAGTYTCEIIDHNKNTNKDLINITVFDLGQSYINISPELGISTLNVTAGKPNVMWIINIDAYPQVNLSWRNNKGEEIVQGTKDKYYIERTKDTSVTLKIFRITLNDSGIYQLIASNGIGNKTLNLTLQVEDKPVVEIESADYHMLGKTSELKCYAAGYPIPDVQWWFSPCTNCISYPITENLKNEISGSRITSTLNIIANNTGLIKCIAYNKLGNSSETKGFYVTDVDEGFQFWGVNDTFLAVGDTLELTCAASIYNYTNNLDIFLLTNNEIKPIHRKNANITKSVTNYTNRITLILNSVNLNDSGTYVCRSIKLDSNGEEKIAKQVVVHNPFSPNITKTNMNGTELQMKPGQPVELFCEVEGIPIPTVTWQKNKQIWKLNNNGSHIKFSPDNKHVYFGYLDEDDTGEYSCRAENRIGHTTRTMRLTLAHKSPISTTLIVVFVLVFIFLIIISIILIIKIRKEKRLQRELKIAGLQNFEKGAIESLNPDLGIDDQAELLPYDKKWEFPRDKLKLGKQLGSGAFGVVMKADAFGLVEGETVSTVAVKMVKRNADYTYIKSLASELKIMVHLGKHLNVVNLLGACTKNVAKRELLVIVEYCRFGNIHNYLLRNRDNFINQIDPESGVIDCTIGSDHLCRTMSVGSNQSENVSPVFAGGVDYRLTPNPSTSNTESTALCGPTSEDTMILSNNSAQPDWRSNYRGDYNKKYIKPITTHDLLCWAFQVARGMEYLASRKVLHGDLAARNILLAEENIVKICDFGLAKSMYKTDNYKKKGNGLLPFKWMAIESIRDRVFSTQSDVWSFGIVLWEFFSLARTPYPGMDANERLYNKLVEGYRMDSPEYATKEIFQIMKDCWLAKPINRPTFSILAEELGGMLQDSVRQHYIQLNDHYIQMNNMQMEGQSDYLAMVSPPDYGNLASPHHYVNDSVQIGNEPTLDTSTSGYLPMDIFSPKPNSSIFDFDVQKKPKSPNDEIATAQELKPILHVNSSDSDGELSPTVPVQTTSFNNPNYQTTTSTSTSTSNNVDDNKLFTEPKKEILHSSDNYVNMPQQKIALKQTDAFSNPSYVDINKKQLVQNDNENNYVNSHSRDWEKLTVST